MNYVKVDGGIVVQRQPYHENGFIEAPESVICGWLWDGLQFAAPTPLPPAVTSTCTRRQGRLALLHAGKLDAAEGVIAGIADPMQRKAAQIEYEADTWERTNPFLQALWAGLGGTESELDDLFIDAAQR